MADELGAPAAAIVDQVVENVDQVAENVDQQLEEMEEGQGEEQDVDDAVSDAVEEETDEEQEEEDQDTEPDEEQQEDEEDQEARRVEANEDSEEQADREHEADEEPQQQQEDEDASKAVPFPLMRIKRIVKLDRDIKLLNRQALVAISHAAKLFVESLTAEAFSAMLTSKHKTMRIVDVEAAVRSKRKLLDFLEDSMDIFQISKQAGHDSHEEESEQHSKAAKKMPVPPPGTRCITEFFGTHQQA